MQEIFEENKSELLYGAIVWMPMLATDNVNAANEREIRFSDSRLKQFWDPNHIFGRLFAQTLNLKEPIAWDVYLVYPPKHPWDTELPPAPAFWMHQLHEEPALLLDPVRLKQYVQTLMANAKHQL